MKRVRTYILSLLDNLANISRIPLRTGCLVTMIVLLSTSCVRNHEERHLMARAESLLMEQPATSLSIMSSIERRGLSSEALARYALIYSEACYYNRVLVSSDSLTRIAVDYYADTRHYHEQARAYFQHGLVLQLGDKMPEAILAFTNAQDAIEEVEDLRLKGNVNRTMGDVYRARYCYHNSLDAYRTALGCFTKLNLPYHCYYTKYNIGQVAVKMHNYQEAESLFLDVRDYAIKNNNLDFLCAVLHELCELYLKQEEYDKCRHTIDLFNEYDCVRWFISRFYAVNAIVTSVEGNHDMALRYIAEAESVENRDDAIIARAKYITYSNMGDMANALYWLNVVNDNVETRLLEASEQPVLNYQIDLLRSTLEKDAREMEVIHQRNIVFYIATIIVITLILLAARNHRRRLQRDIAHYMETINELQLSRSDNLQPLSEAINHLYNDRLKDLNDLYETYYDHIDTPRQATRVFERVRQTIEAIKGDEARLSELESMVNSCRNGLMERLREQCPKLSEKEYRVVLYSYAGFSSRAICIFIDSNPVALSKVKYRIKTKIKESGCVDAETFISALNEH